MYFRYRLLVNIWFTVISANINLWAAFIIPITVQKLFFLFLDLCNPLFIFVYVV